MVIVTVMKSSIRPPHINPFCQKYLINYKSNLCRPKNYALDIIQEFLVKEGTLLCWRWLSTSKRYVWSPVLPIRRVQLLVFKQRQIQLSKEKRRNTLHAHFKKSRRKFYFRYRRYWGRCWRPDQQYLLRL